MDARTRLGWVRLYEEVGNAGVVCRRCGISRPTLRKWWRRYQGEGEAGLHDRSRPGLSHPTPAVHDHHQQQRDECRQDRGLPADHGADLVVVDAG